LLFFCFEFHQLAHCHHQKRKRLGDFFFFLIKPSLELE